MTRETPPRRDDGYAENKVRLHVMKKGESILRIANANGVSVQDLLEWNGVKDITAFYEGQTIRLQKPAK